jgi:hypothetical protein
LLFSGMPFMAVFSDFQPADESLFTLNHCIYNTPHFRYQKARVLS